VESEAATSCGRGKREELGIDRGMREKKKSSEGRNGNQGGDGQTMEAITMMTKGPGLKDLRILEKVTEKKKRARLLRGHRNS